MRFFKAAGLFHGPLGVNKKVERVKAAMLDSSLSSKLTEVKMSP